MEPGDRKSASTKRMCLSVRNRCGLAPLRARLGVFYGNCEFYWDPKSRRNVDLRTRSCLNFSAKMN
jgi:hypothetical protein